MSVTRFASNSAVAAPSRFLRNRSGAAMVEFGLVFPLVIATFCGVVYFGTYMFNSNRMDHALREAGRQVMMLETPTEGDVRSVVSAVLDEVNLPGEDSSIEIEEDPDDKSRVAIIEFSMSMVQNTGYLDVSELEHRSSLRVPLFDR